MGTMDRNIFKYNVNGEDRYADPVEMHREFICALHPEVGGDLLEACTLAQTHDDKGIRVRADQQANKYRGYLVEAFRKVFNLPRFNPMNQEGYLEDQVWEIMRQFFDFDLKKKESIDRSPMSVPYSEFPGNSVTTNTMDSGSTPHAV